jgi:4-amino-4-deoxy-L-arabinose transferase-like glycosyltransferase
MDLTKLIQTQFSNLQLSWIFCALFFGFVSIILFLKGKYGYSLLFLFLSGLILRLVTASLDPFLWTWDEQYHALVAKNMILHPFKPMLVSHPVLEYDFRNWKENSVWLHKQPGFLWQIALFFKIFGTGEFVLRLPTVIMMSLMILLIYRIGKRVSTPAIAWYGAFLYAFSFFFVQFTSGCQYTDHNDAAFIFYVTLSIWAWVEYTDSKKQKWLVMVGLFAGMAILNKWLVGLLVYSGWSLSILFCHVKSEWLSEHRKMGLSLLVPMLVVLPWQIFILWAFPAESRYEFLYNSRHFFEALEGHSESKYYYFYLLPEQYGGFPAMMLVIPGLYLFFQSMKERVFKTAFSGFLVITYLFFTLSATKMPMFCTVVSPVIFLSLGAVVAWIAAKLQRLVPAHISFWILVLFLGYLAFETLEINRIDSLHSDRISFWKTKNTDVIIDKLVSRRLPSKDYVVFNCAKNNAVVFMFYSGATAYDCYPGFRQYTRLKSQGIKMATFADAGLPVFLKEDRAVMKFYLKPYDY